MEAKEKKGFVLMGAKTHLITQFLSELEKAQELIGGLYLLYTQCANAHELREPLSIKELIHDPEILNNAMFEKASSENLIGTFKPNKKMFLESIEMPPGFKDFLKKQGLVKKIITQRKPLNSAIRFLTIGKVGVERREELIEEHQESLTFYAKTEKQKEAYELAMQAEETYQKIVELQGGILTFQAGCRFPLLLPDGSVDFTYISTLN